MSQSFLASPRLFLTALLAVFVLGSSLPAHVALAIEPPELTAVSVYSHDLETGIVLYEQNADVRRQVGSTVKVVTALVVLEHGNPADEVLIQQEDTVDITVYSNMQLQVGDTLTVGTLLYGLLLPSGNDGALALARHVGSQMCECDDRNDAVAAFVEAMNEYAANLGLVDTNFTNPDGIDHDSAYSTAHDMAMLFGELMKSERLAGIVAESAYSFWSVGSDAHNYTGQTTNQMLGESGVIGGKTGTTPNAGACAVLARTVEGGTATVITAILGAEVEYDGNGYVVDGSDQRWNDARSLFTAMDRQFSWVVPGQEGTFPGLGDELAVWEVEIAGAPVVPYPVEGVDTAYQLVLNGDDSGELHLFFGDQAVGVVPVQPLAAASNPGGRV